MDFGARPGTIKSVVYDVEPLWRRTLASMLQRRMAGSVVVCRSLDELEAALTDEPPPRLLVGDPGDGPAFEEVLALARESAPELTTIAVSAGRDELWRASLEAAGVSAFIAKENEVEVIERSLREAIDAEVRWARLTPRELEILELVAEGRSNREVASLLWLSDQTVKFHLANIYRRLGVTGRAEAVAEARREGLLRDPLRAGSLAIAAEGGEGTGAAAG
jgi:DNA-binding NarL/FixJ family response regulator